MKLSYIIPGPPVAWCSHRGFGKRSYNPHFYEKRDGQRILSVLHSGKDMIDQPIGVLYEFRMPIPKSMPKKTVKLIQSGERIYCPVRKDLTNMQKFAEDLLTGIVIKDDNIVVKSAASKFYSLTPATLIEIETL